jgi:hypothetical protein
MLPAAFVTHLTSGRLRLKIPSARGDRDYLAEIGRKLSGIAGVNRIEINPATGSILILYDSLGLEGLSDFALEQGLFELTTVGPQKEPLSKRIVKPLSEVSASVRRLSGGELDLPGLVFITLLGVGAVQILRGNVGAPPWYTAFWYALGVFTKSLTDKVPKQEQVAAS